MLVACSTFAGSSHHIRLSVNQVGRSDAASTNPGSCDGPYPAGRVWIPRPPYLPSSPAGAGCALTASDHVPHAPGNNPGRSP
ncbi:hypothetical protein GCM10020218_067860 [Dactylosporangium vinaceum]